MKRSLVIILSAMLSYLSANAQKVLHPSEIKNAVYYDVSLPLREMPMLKPGANNMRWKDGEIPNIFLPVWKEQNKYTGFEVDPVLQDEMGLRAPISTVVNFDGIAGDGGYAPPDENGDIGINYYIETVNVSFAIYTKSGDSVYGPANMSTLWQGFPGGYTSDGDPIVLFDHLANRWLISQFSLPNFPNGPFYELFAISQSENPMGSWNRYAFQFSNMPDYPKLGVWPDGYYYSGNSFSPGALNWKGPFAAVLERDSMLVGSPARMAFFQQSQGEESMLPADLDGPAPPAGSPGYFAKIKNVSGDTDQLRLYQLHADWADTANISLLGPYIINTASFYNSVSSIPQKGTSRKLDVLSKYLMNRLQYRNFGTYEAMVANHTVNPEGEGRAGVRWYELRKSNSEWDVYQQGTYAPDSLCRWMGSIAMDVDGNIALGYSLSGDSIYPSIGITGRRANDEAGTMTFMENRVINGTGAQTGTERWGDYSSLSVDPVDDHTFWYTSEYIKTTSYMTWNTRIASFTINDLHVDIKNNTQADNEVHSLLPNFPNPFSTFTTIRWILAEPCHVKLVVQDFSGKVVSTLVNSYQKAGEHQLNFDASGISAGIYYCKFLTGKTIETQKLIVIR